MYYPMMMNLEGKSVVVIGGGQVAFQKLKGLEHTKAHIKIVSPKISEVIKEWLKHHHAKWDCKHYDASDLEGADLIIAATDNREVHNQIRQDKKRHQLLLQVDNPACSDFILPAVLRRGKLSIAISTGGANPGLTRKIKNNLEKQFDHNFGEYVEFLEVARKTIINEITDAEIKRKCLKRLLASEFYELSIEGKIKERDELFQQ